MLLHHDSLVNFWSLWCHRIKYCVATLCSIIFTTNNFRMNLRHSWRNFRPNSSNQQNSKEFDRVKSCHYNFNWLELSNFVVSGDPSQPNNLTCQSISRKGLTSNKLDSMSTIKSTAIIFRGHMRGVLHDQGYQRHQISYKRLKKSYRSAITINLPILHTWFRAVFRFGRSHSQKCNFN